MTWIFIIPVGLKDSGPASADWFSFELSWGHFIMLGMEAHVLVPMSKDARVNLPGMRSCEQAFKNGDFALASKI